MRAVIFAGGKGSRFGNGATDSPKPLVSVYGRPIIWHVMKIYEQAGLNDFLICLGYKKEYFYKYFINYHIENSIIDINTLSGDTSIIEGSKENWNVILKDSGVDTNTGGRVKSAESIIGKETFTLTYGDSLVDIDIRKVTDFHKMHGKLATVTGVRRRSSYGDLIIEKDKIIGMKEKAVIGDTWINAGFFVLESGVFDYISSNQDSWESDIMPALAHDEQLMLYQHEGFWHPMDTVKDRDSIEAVIKNTENGFLEIL